MSNFDYDVLVIGSGFGGSVTALRLTEKGYRVGVLEAGRRFDEPAEPFPRAAAQQPAQDLMADPQVSVGAVSSA